MSLTNEERDLMNKRDDLTDDETAAIDAAFITLYASDGVKIATDDRAARAEAALIRLILDSRGK